MILFALGVFAGMVALAVACLLVLFAIVLIWGGPKI